MRTLIFHIINLYYFMPLPALLRAFEFEFALFIVIRFKAYTVNVVLFLVRVLTLVLLTQLLVVRILETVDTHVDRRKIW